MLSPFKRKFLAVAVAATLAGPGSALALGLGPIEVHSPLNKPLDADIELLSVNPGELATLEAGLAPARTFKAAGIDRPAVLSSLNFTVQTRPNGRSYVRITSRDSIREPFLNFLLEVKGARGAVAREFALFLDPAATLVRRQAAKPSVSRPQPLPKPGAAQQKKAVQKTSPQVTAPAIADMDGGGDYGPIRRGESLWGIADRLRPDSSVSVPQMMAALLEANPKAFYKPNVDSLSAGATLRVPVLEGHESMAATAPMVETAVVTSTPDTTTSARNPELQIAQTVTQPTVEPEVAPSRLKLVSPDDSDEQALQPSLEGGQNGSATGGTGVEADYQIPLEGENPKLQVAGLEDIEGRAATIGVDDSTLIAMQDAGSEMVEDEDSNEMTTDAGVAGDDGMAMDQSEADDAMAMDQTEADDAMGMDKEGEVGTVLVDPVVEVATAISETPPLEGMDAYIAKAKEVAGNAGTIAGDMASSISERFMGTVDKARAGDNAARGMLGGGAAALLGVLYLLGRRRKEDDDFVEVSRDPAAAPVAKVAGAAAALQQATAMMGGGNFGRAESVLVNALSESPGDVQLTTKLLDLYYETGDQANYLEQAKSLRNVLGNGGHAVWDKVAARGRSMCPGESIFNEVADEALASDLDSIMGDVTPEELDERPELDWAEDEVRPKDSGTSDEFSAFMGDQAAADSVSGSDDLDLEMEAGTAPVTDGFSFDNALPEEIEPIDDFEIDAAMESGAAEMASDAELESAESTNIVAANDEVASAEDATMEFQTYERPDTPAKEESKLDIPEGGLDMDWEESSARLTEDPAVIDGIGEELDDLSMDMDFESIETKEMPSLTDDLDDDLTLEMPDDFDAPMTSEAADDLEFDAPALSDATDDLDFGAPMLSDAADDLDFDAPALSEAADDLDFGLDTPIENDDSPAGLSFDNLPGAAIGAAGAVAAGVAAGAPSGVDSSLVDTKLELAMAYLDMEDSIGAKSLLAEVVKEGNASQIEKAKEVLAEIG